MIRTKLLLLFLLFSFLGQAQITDLKKLSSGKFYSSDIIKDSNNNIKGYFYLFETDKVSKETFQLEYVVLDENLTKVTSGFITEMKFESWLIDAKSIKVKVMLNNNKLLIRFTDDFGQGGVEGYGRYRILDLQTNKLSDPFIFNHDKLVLNPTFDRKMKNYKNNFSHDISFYNEAGLIVNCIETNETTKKENYYLALFDDNFKQVWKIEYENGTNKKSTKSLKYLNSDKDVIVMFNHVCKNWSKYLNDFSVLMYDAKKGTLITEFLFPNITEYTYKVVDVKITEKEVILLGNLSAKSEFGFTNDTDNIGLFSYKLDKFTGKILNKKELFWKDIAGQLNINAKGKIKDEGYIYIHNILSLSDGRTIAICEAFYQDPITVNNIYFLELSKDFKLVQIFVVDKFKNKFPRTLAHSDTIKLYGLFDFMDYQNLGDDEFLFFLNDNEKNSRNRKKSTLYGIVSFSEGKFKRQTLNLKTETSTIIAFPSKKGYMTLIENFDEKDKPSEIRLEKINY